MYRLALILFFCPFTQAFSEKPIVPGVPTRAQADATIAVEMQLRQEQDAARKAAIEAVPASEEWEVDHGNRKTILRRVAPVIPQSRDESQIANAEFQIASSDDDAWMAGEPVSRNLNLTALVFDESFTEITWRDENLREWTLLSNIDFRYLSGIGSFEDKTHYWMTFLFVYEVDSEKEAKTARLAAKKGVPHETRTADIWLDVIPEDFLNNAEPEYIIIAENEESSIPVALYEELDALHQYYQANEERLIAEYERNKVLNEARRAWHEANPPEPKDTVINFWKVH
jgi:hypothetical protein